MAFCHRQPVAERKRLILDTKVQTRHPLHDLPPCVIILKQWNNVFLTHCCPQNLPLLEIEFAELWRGISEMDGTVQHSHA